MLIGKEGRVTNGKLFFFQVSRNSANLTVSSGCGEMPAFHMKRSPPMCDYSLHHVANRPAKIEDKLVATKFRNAITRGFAAVGIQRCGLPAAWYRDRIRRECRMRALIRHRHVAEQELGGCSRTSGKSTWTTPWPITMRWDFTTDRWFWSRACALASAPRYCNYLPIRAPQLRRRPSSSRSFGRPRFRSDHARRIRADRVCNTKGHRHQPVACKSVLVI